MIEEHPYPDREALFAALARHIGERLQAAVESRGQASLVVSGGRTPAPLFSALSAMALPWERVVVTLADERWVADDDPARNATLVRDYLLQDRAARATWVDLKTPDPTPEAGLDTAARRLAGIPRPFDIVILGMGDDGHTASLFPCADTIVEALESEAPCVAVHPRQAPHARLSLTPRALLDSRERILLFTGATKWRVYLAARREPEKVREMPVRILFGRDDPRPSLVAWAP